MALTAFAVVFAALIAVGVGLIFLPAGLIVAGLLGLGGCYLYRYLSI